MFQKKIKILIFAPDFFPNVGGFSNAITNFVKKLTEEQFIEKLIVFTPIKLPSKCEELKLPRTKIYRSSFLPIKLTTFISPLKWYREIKKILKEEKIDLIFYETGSYPLLALLLLKDPLVKNNSVKFILRLHGSSDTFWYKFPPTLFDRAHSIFAKILYRKLSIITATTPSELSFVKKEFLKNNFLLIGRKKWFVIPNIYLVSSQKRQVITNFPFFSTHSKIFLTLGRLSNIGLNEKGFFDLIDALQVINFDEPKILDNAKALFILVGSGEKLNFVKEKVKNANLEKYFLFFEHLPNATIHFLQSKVTATILLSRYEGLSMFALEALANGSPLLFSNVGGLKELVINGKNGYLVEPQNIEEIAEAIKRFLLLPDEIILKMREESQKIFQEKFLPEKIMKKFREICEIIME